MTVTKAIKMFRNAEEKENLYFCFAFFACLRQFVILDNSFDNSNIGHFDVLNNLPIDFR